MDNYFKKAFFDILAVTGSLVTISLALFPEELGSLVKNYKIFTVLTFIIINQLVFLYITRRVYSIDLKINETTNLNVSYGDIFKKDGIIVIPVNDLFDTIVGKKIVSEKTLHGMFINKYFDTEEKLNNLNEQIVSSLSDTNFVTVSRKDGIGNTKKYPLGTTAIVDFDNKKFFLVAVAEFNLSTNRVFLKIPDYLVVMSRMIEFIHNYSQGFNVNIPLIGGAQLGIDLPKEKLLEMIIFSMHTAEKIAVLDGINIVLHSSVAEKINLNKINFIFNKY